MERKFNWPRITLAFLIAVFLFAFGLLAGYVAKEYIQGASLTLEETARNEIIELETIYLLDSQFQCNTEALDITSSKLDNLGELITTLEQKKGKNDQEVLGLKKIYTVLETRHYLLISQRNKQCAQKYSVFFYFYSNGEKCHTPTKEISTVLTYIRNKYDFVRVYSFDVDLNSDIIGFLKKKYGADSCVTVVLDEQKINFTPANAAELEAYLLKSRNNL